MLSAVTTAIFCLKFKMATTVTVKTFMFFTIWTIHLTWALSESQHRTGADPHEYWYDEMSSKPKLSKHGVLAN